MLRAYQASSAFTQLRDRTRKDSGWPIARIERQFASFLLAAYADARTRGIFLAWRDQLGTLSLRQADLTWAVLNAAVNWGTTAASSSATLSPRPGAFTAVRAPTRYGAMRTRPSFLASAPERFRLPFLMAVWTGQRQGDLLRLPWSSYDGKSIRLRQSKTGARRHPSWRTSQGCAR